MTSETETLVYWFDRANVAEAKLAAANARALVSEDENAELSRERLALREQLGQVLQRRASEYPYGIQVSAVVETLWPLIEQALAAAEATLAQYELVCTERELADGLQDEEDRRVGRAIRYAQAKET